MLNTVICFKPYYKWNTFNTNNCSLETAKNLIVLNLIINGIPSIHGSYLYVTEAEKFSFKPINGIPSILSKK